MRYPSTVLALVSLIGLAGCSRSTTEAPGPSGDTAVAEATGSGSPGSAVVEEGFVTTPDTRLYYQKTGSGTCTIILPARLFTFEDLRPLGARCTLIAYDMRNRGKSAPVAEDSKISIEADVADLESVRARFGVEKFIPVGYSYLGLMVVMYAMQHPEHVDRIVQLGPVPLKFGTTYRSEFAAPDWEGSLDPDGLASLRKLREEGFHESHPKEYCESEWQVTRFSLVGDPSKVDRLPDAICEMENEWPTNLARHFSIHFAQSVQKLDIPREEVARVSAPVLTIHGTSDRNAPYGAGRDWAYLLPDARLLTVTGAAHQSFAERPDIVLPAIETFLGGEWPAESVEVTEDPREPA